MLNQEKKMTILARASQVPIFSTLNFEIDDVSDGGCRIKFPRKPDYDGIFESFHGGLLMTVADTAAAFAILTLTEENVSLATTDMNIRFLAPCMSDVFAVANVIKLGRTMCPVNVEIFDSSGKRVSIAQVNYMLLQNSTKNLINDVESCIGH